MVSAGVLGPCLMLAWVWVCPSRATMFSADPGPLEAVIECPRHGPLHVSSFQSLEIFSHSSHAFKFYHPTCA